MKNKKLHVFPLQITFLKKIQAGAKFYNETHYTNFDVSSLEVTAFEFSFDRQEYWPADAIIEKALKTLSIHNPKYLRKLKISIQASSLFNISTIRHFGLSLSRQFKTLEQLDLRFLSCYELNRGNMRDLLDALTKGMKSLTEVNICFLGDCDINDQCLEDIKLSIFKRCKSLQRLKVVIDGFVLGQWGKGFVYFESDLNERLQNHNLVAGYYGQGGPNKITMKGGQSLCRGIARYLKKLRSFTFKMSTSDEHDKKLAKDILKMMSSLTNLETLNFSVWDFLKIDDEYLAELISSIAQLKSLQSLSLDFPPEIVTSETGYQLLAQDLFSNLSSQLVYLALRLEDRSKVIDNIVKNIGLNSAKNLKNLQTLILDFGEMYQLTNKALSELPKNTLKKLILSCDRVKKDLPLILPKQIQEFDLYSHHSDLTIHESWENLNRLSLNLDTCQEKESFADLFSEPSLTLKNLNQLRLMYSHPNKIENKEIRSLASEIGTKLENLTSLELGFYDCPLLTSESLLSLGDSICKNLKKLRHLNFTFTSSDEYLHSSLLEGGMIYLTFCITSRLENLESLILSFHGVMDEQINMEQMLDEFCSLISRSLKKLKKLSLMFNLYEDIELKYQIRENLCHIPMLYMN